MKKIIIIIRKYLNGGLERQVVNLSNEFAEIGYSVDIVAFKGVYSNQFYGIHKNVNVRLVSFNERNKSIQYIDTSNSQNQSDSLENIGNSAVNQNGDKSTSRRNIINRKLRKTAIWLWEYSALMRRVNIRRDKFYRKYFREAKPDFVISFDLNNFGRALFGTKGLKCKLFDAEMNAHQKTIPQDRVGKRYYYGLLKKADGIIVQTQSEKEYFEKYSKNVYVINNPIRPDLPFPYEGIRKKVIVNFCRIAPQKNLDLLLDAFQKFHYEYPDYVLKIYGYTNNQEEFDYKNNLINKIRNMKMNGFVFILPSETDVHKKILDSAMFVSSSDYEGLSNSMLEAMAIGLPCVCTDCLGGGTREVMIDHENGLIVPMNSPDAMYLSMKEYVENPELAEKCSRNAAKIKDRLSAERIVKQWIEVLEG